MVTDRDMLVIDSDGRASGYSVDIQMAVPKEDKQTYTLNLGLKFADAVNAFNLLVSFNIWRDDLVYIRFVHMDQGAPTRVLSRRTKSGHGDW